MKSDERELRALVDKLGTLQGDGTSTSIEREYTMRVPGAKAGGNARLRRGLPVRQEHL